MYKPISISTQQDQAWLESISTLAVEAGLLIMRIREQGYITHKKEDASPVTEADRLADAMICDALRQLTPHIPIVSEEGTQHEDARLSGTFWCIDPLDGTKSFIRGEDEFTVNIGLIVQGEPRLGAIYLPVPRILYIGGVGHGAWRMRDGQAKEAISARIATQGSLTAVTSARHGITTMEHLRSEYGITHSMAASSSLKFCVLAEGKADIYPRMGTTMEWDTAAGHALLCAAGGSVEEMHKKSPLRYGKEDFRNPHFVAYGRTL